eukprot:CAMPEP_0185795648 /NCGR_PEP_ID=MMETSP1174-20130828/160658_1 /TAXON_ID=35687 /ORGANISM="Dictyocha speculum, Strain CCMP1381" /LENGTH=315 /DNA_ID=CAMNT_0028490949 /DNA_START=573 /DNA_END=1520 /DNA_ORIENTATION=+
MVMTLVVMAWSVLFALAMYGVQDWFEYKDLSNAKQIFAWIGLVIVYFWSCQVFRNIIVTTTSGTAAEWVFARPYSPVHPTWSAFDRAVTTNLGSICMGSFFVAVVQTVALVVTKLQKRAEDSGYKCVAWLLCCCVCCAKCFANFAEQFSSYAFIVVGVYGHGFVKAGAHAARLFRDNGLLLLQMDALVELVLAMGSVVVGLTTGAFAALLAEKGPSEWVEGLKNATLIFAIIGSLMGFAVCQTCMSVIEAANASVLVIWMENPHAFEQNHPEEYTALHASWKKLKRTEVSVDYFAEGNSWNRHPGHEPGVDIVEA